MTSIKLLFCAAVSSLSLAACSTDRLSPAERDAAVGGAIGAAAGAAIAKNDAEGALIGGALGAAIGYYKGCKDQGGDKQLNHTSHGNHQTKNTQNNPHRPKIQHPHDRDGNYTHQTRHQNNTHLT